MRAMERSEWWNFASAGTRTGKVAVSRSDGLALVTPIWFLLNEVGGGSPDELLFTTDEKSAKYRILRRDPRLSLVVDDQTPPYSYVQFTGTAVLDDDPDALLHWATRIAARYMGDDRADAYGRRNAVPGEWLVRMQIERVNAPADVAD